MRFFYTLFFITVLIATLGAMNKKAQCVCDKTEPYKCECKECNCANED